MSGASRVLLAVALAGSAATAPAASGTPDLAAVGLRCEYVTDPLGIDVAAPRLSWALSGSARGERQTGYRILVSGSRAQLDRDSGDLWDTGQVSSDQTTQVTYGGQPLTSSQQVFWKVRVWDKDGAPSTWSPAASWTMGLLEAGAWRARWITAPSESATVLARREFVVGPGLTRGVVHVSGLGQVRAVGERREDRWGRTRTRLDEVRQDLPVRHARHHHAGPPGSKRDRAAARRRHVSSARRALCEVHGRDGPVDGDRARAARVRRRPDRDHRHRRPVADQPRSHHVLLHVRR